MKIFYKKIRQLIKKPLGFIRTVLNQKLNQYAPSCHERLMQMKKIGFAPEIIFDCGAFNGMWTRKTSKIFPGAQFLLIEPNKTVIDNANKNIGKITPKPILINAALGDKPQTSYLNIWGDPKQAVGASLLDHVNGQPDVTIETKIIPMDNLTENKSFFPDLVKLDLQGAELAALKGATKILAKTELLIVEFGCLEAYIERTTPQDLINIIYENNYILYDIVDLAYRPYDGALTGGDFFFLKSDSRLRSHKGWK